MRRMRDEKLSKAADDLISAFAELGVDIRAHKDETRLYNCGGLPVELTLPEGEHEENWGYPFEWEIELIPELAEYEDF